MGQRWCYSVTAMSSFQKLDVEEPDSANSSFYSTQSAPAPQASLRATSSTQSLARLGSPDDGNSALLSLPGYRPTTRSSARRSQARMSSGAPQGEATAGGNLPQPQTRLGAESSRQAFLYQNFWPHLPLPPQAFPVLGLQRSRWDQGCSLIASGSQCERLLTL